MFVSTTHLPQVLPAEAYHGQPHYEQELAELFLPAWHFVGSTAEIPREGDYLTQHVLGHPLLIWRSGGQVHVFLNVCAHRSCMITHQPAGCAQRLKCQYHGWEYDETGRTRKIPDATSFRPMAAGVVGLRKFRSEVVGQCIFFTLNDDAPSLEEYLGPGYELCRGVSSGNWEFMGVGDRVMEANWKVYIENTIETYHVETVHPTTLQIMPPEATCTHEFDERWSLLKTSGKPEDLNWLDQVAHRMLGAEHDPDYHNLLIYPHLVIGKMSLFSWVDQVLPVGPDKMHIIARGFSNTGKYGWLRSGLMAWLVRRWGRRFLSTIVSEDASVLPSVQRGLRSPMQPNGGLISVREERIYHFQRYVQRATRCAAAAEPFAEPEHRPV